MSRDRSGKECLHLDPDGNDVVIAPSGGQVRNDAGLVRKEVRYNPLRGGYVFKTI